MKDEHAWTVSHRPRLYNIPVTQTTLCLVQFPKDTCTCHTKEGVQGDISQDVGRQEGQGKARREQGGIKEKEEVWG